MHHISTFAIVKVLIPVIVMVVVAKYVGDLFNHGIYEVAMEQKEYGYLDHHIKQSYDMFRVCDIMSSPVVALEAVESAAKIERPLLETSHHGFPVVDAATGNILGLVRRDQLVALLECRIFAEKVNNGPNQCEFLEGQSPIRTDLVTDEYASRKRSAMPSYLSRRGDTRLSSLFHNDSERPSYSWLKRDSALFPMAFHIRDDRYDDESAASHCCRIARGKRRAADTLDSPDSNDVPGHEHSLPRHSSALLDWKTSVDFFDGKIVAFLSPEDMTKRVNVAAVMNRGAYTATEGLPLSKAYDLFVSLGLRHLCVLGERGQVTGMITRSNLRQEYLEEKTGYKF